MNVGPLAITFVYGIFSDLVSTDIRLFLVAPPFIVHMTFISRFGYVLGYLS